MANKRIRELTMTNTFPEGALVPLDAAGLSEAKAIGSSELVDAVSLLIAPHLVVDDEGAAEENSVALDAALAHYAASGNKKTILRLSRGIVHLSRVIPLTWEHSGIKIDGDGCILVYPANNPGAPGEFILAIGMTGEAPTGFRDPFAYTDDPFDPNVIKMPLNVPIENYQPGDALLLFEDDEDAEGRVFPQQTVTIESVSSDALWHYVTLREEVNSGFMVGAAKWLLNGRKVKGTVAAGATTIVLDGTVPMMNWKDQWAYMTDGVSVIELYGEYIRVLDATESGGETTLTLERGVRQSYITGRAAVIPPGKWVENVTIRNLTLGGKYNYPHETVNMSAKFCVNLRLEGLKSKVALANLVDAGTLISTSQSVVIADGQFTEGKGLSLGATRDAVIERTRALVRNEEFCGNVVYRDCDFVGHYKHIIGCAETHAERCRFWDVEHFGFGNDCSLVDCDVYSPAGYFYASSNRNTFRGVRCQSGSLLIWIQGGADHYVEDIRANLRIDVSSTGMIAGPIVGDLSGYNVNTPSTLPAGWSRLTRAPVKLALPTTVNELVVLGKLSGNRSAIWARESLAVIGYGNFRVATVLCLSWLDRVLQQLVCLSSQQRGQASQQYRRFHFGTSRRRGLELVARSPNGGHRVGRNLRLCRDQCRVHAGRQSADGQRRRLSPIHQRHAKKRIALHHQSNSVVERSDG